MYQRNTTNNDNRRQFIIQNHYFTYQRKGNHELQIQALNLIVADLQNHINNLSSGNGGGGSEDPDIGTMWFNKKYYGQIMKIYKYMELVFVYISPELIKPCPKLHFSKHHPDQKHNNII